MQISKHYSNNIIKFIYIYVYIFIYSIKNFIYCILYKCKFISFFKYNFFDIFSNLKYIEFFFMYILEFN